MSTQFEKHARDEFEKHQVPIDVESLWENVYPLVKEEKKDRKFLWFFFSGFLIAGAIFTAVYLLQKEDTTSKTKTTTEQTLEDVTPKAATAINKTEATAVLDPETNTTVNIVSTSETSTTASNANANANANANTNTNTKETKIASKKQSSTVSSSKSGSKNNKQITDSTPSATSILNDAPATQKSEAIVPLEAQSSPAAKSSSLGAKQSTTELAVESNISTTESNPPLALESTNTIPYTTTNTTTKEGQDELLLKSLSTSLFSNNLLASLNLPKISKAPKINDLEGNIKDLSRKPSLFKKLKKGTRFGIGLYGGFSGTSYGISGPDSQYVASRMASERQLETIHLGLNVLLQVKKNFYLRTGAEYTRIASLFEYETEQISINDSIPGIVEIRINSLTNDTTEIQGTLTEITTNKYRKKTYNYFHLVDVPIILGYNFAYDNWQFGLEAGVYANVFLRRKGNIFNPDNDFYDLATDENKWYKTNIGITPYIGLNAAYSINDNFQIHASPGFRFNKVFTTNRASPVKEERASLGVRVGLRYFF